MNKKTSPLAPAKRQQGEIEVALPEHLVDILDRLGELFGQEVRSGSFRRLEILSRVILEAQVRYLPPPAGECPDMDIPEQLRGILELSFPLRTMPTAKGRKPGL